MFRKIDTYNVQTLCKFEAAIYKEMYTLRELRQPWLTNRIVRKVHHKV